jgi:hypothetical protein
MWEVEKVGWKGELFGVVGLRADDYISAGSDDPEVYISTITRIFHATDIFVAIVYQFDP